MVHAVDVGAGVVPRTEDSFDSLEELFLRIVGEILAELLFVLRFELERKRFEVVGGEVDVVLDVLLFLHLVDEFFKVFLADFHNDVGEHLYKAAVAVPRPTGVVGLGRYGIDDRFVKTEVEDGIHHARHGSARARTYRNEQRVFLIAELFAAYLLHLIDVSHYLLLDIGIDLASVLIVLSARFRGDREALRNGQPDVGHLGEVRTLAPEQFSHLGVTLGEKIAILFCHFYTPCKVYFVTKYFIIYICGMQAFLPKFTIFIIFIRFYAINNARSDQSA